MKKKVKHFNILKASGEVEPFSPKKLEHSLERAGLSKKKCVQITNKVSQEIGEGSYSRDIFKKALKEVRESSPLATVQYSLKRSLFALGPEGHHFEVFVARYFQRLGFTTQTCQNFKGKFVRHEVDVVAVKDKLRYFVECKFHNHSGIKNDIKTALYVKARWDDLRDGPEGKTLTSYYLASNTAFSLDALTYAKGTGLGLLGVNAPAEVSFLEEIKRLKLYPVTSLSSLSNNQKRFLLSKGFILAEDLLMKTNLLRAFGFKESLIQRVESEVNYILQVNQ